MKLFSTLFIAITGFTAFSQTVLFNSNFGTGGIAITPNTSEINRIAVDADGSIFSAGYSIESGGTGIYHLTLTKHTANGIPVPSFGTNGIVATTIDYSEFPLDIKLQADGKILVAGSTYLGPTQNGPGDYNSFAVRYNPDGSLDQTFGNNGVFKLLHSDSHISSMIVLSDGSVLLAGNSFGTAAISKIEPNGVIDSSFGSNGSAFLSDANYTFILWEAILLSDQTILCAGYDGTDPNNSKLSYCKIDLNGHFIDNFGQNGKVILDLHNTSPQITELLSGVKETANGKLILTGYSTSSLIIQANLDGTLDTNFGTNGVLAHGYPFSDLEIQEDGKFLLGGSDEISDYNYGFSITRLNPDGSIDLSFNGNGTFTADPSPGNDYLQSMKLTESGHILVGGSSPLFSSNSNFMLADIDISQTLNLQEEKADGIEIYPNPFSDKVIISIENESVTSIQLMDAAGRSIGNYKVDKSIVLSLEHLDAGMYHVVFTNDRQEKISRKLIKQ
jgi:uncharacterized delta-60 repeat protein